MKKSLLSRLRSNGVSYIISALLLLLGIPLYQALVLVPQGYNTALSANGTTRFSTYLTWISGHSLQFLLYRALLIIAFALIFTLPYSLYRIIVAQELMGQAEQAEAEESEEPEEASPSEAQDKTDQDEQADAAQTENDALPPNAWRGKGFAILAIWAGILGLSLYLLGTLASTLYLLIVSGNLTGAAADNVTNLSSIFTITANTVGIGLLALSTLFFGAFIVRSGLNLWPGIWVAFGYTALGLTPLLTGSAVAVATAPGSSQGLLTSLATLLFALWVLWLGIMLVRLKPE
ncbi:MAG TPA: hypothetical protein VFB12_01840 [Ktedonobacteraceae bacterium]|nr:hypothetical protein [Ktedonobacteraceae bacterium]